MGIFAWIPGIGQGQTTRDSLWTVWNDTTQADTVRTQALREIVKKHIYPHPDSAFYYGQMLYDFAEARNLKRAMGNALYSQGQALHFSGRYHESMTYTRRNLDIQEDFGNKTGIANSLHNIGMAHMRLGNHDSAFIYYNQSLQLKKELGNRRNTAITLTNLGTVHRIQGNVSKAIENYTQCLKIYEEYDDKRNMAATLNNIGLIYMDQEEDDKALAYYGRCLAVSEEINLKRGIGVALTNMAIIYKHRKQFSTALDYHQRCLKIHEETKDKLGTANSLRHIGTVYHDKSEYSKALEYYLQSLELKKELGNKHEIAVSHDDIALTYLHLDKPAQTIRYASQGLRIAQEIGSSQIIEATSKTLFKAYKQTGQYDKALDMHELHIEMRDSLQSEENQREIIRQEYKYTYEKQALADSLTFAKEQELKDITIRRERTRRNALAIGLGLLLLLAGGIFWQYLQTKKARAQAELEHARSEELLLNILPAETAVELKEKGYTTARRFEAVTVLFADIKGFTTIAESLSAEELVAEIDTYFRAFDEIMLNHGLEKIKTIGDAYIAVGGLPQQNHADAVLVLAAAMEMQQVVSALGKERELQARPFFQLRIGLHTGPVVAGVVGIKKFQYDIWGDTVNIAARMEQNSEPGRINMSQATYELVKEHPEIQFISRGSLPVKNKGEMLMYFVS